jgi:hypothetical protein
MAINKGGSAFPGEFDYQGKESVYRVAESGMTIRDWFAATIQYSKDLMEDVSRCDDQDLIERFGIDSEKDEYFDFVSPERSMPFKNILLRAKLEARARACIRYAEADAMIAERDKPEGNSKEAGK